MGPMASEVLQGGQSCKRFARSKINYVLCFLGTVETPKKEKSFTEFVNSTTEGHMRCHFVGNESCD